MLFLLSIPAMIGAFVFARNSTRKDLCAGVFVNIENPAINFVTQQDILKITENEGVLPHVVRMQDIQTTKIEHAILQNPWVKHAQLFITPQHTIRINIEQKEPIVRIQLNDSTAYAYYLDAYANPLQLHAQFTPLVPVVTTPKLGYGKKDLQLKSDLVKLATYIQHDTFWNAAIAQIDVNHQHEISIIPMLGNQEILLGNTIDLEDKMSRLLAFYQQGIQTIRWGLYDQIDIRYKGQVVCRNLRGQILAEDPYDNQLKSVKYDTIKQTNAKPIQQHAVSAAPVKKQETIKKITPVKPIQENKKQLPKQNKHNTQTKKK